MKRLSRAPRSADRVLSGAAGGWAARWGVDPTVVRVSLAVLGLVGGLGVALYLAAVVLSDPAERESESTRGPVPPDQRRDLSIGVATAAVLVLARSIGLWAGDSVMAGAVAAALGVAVVWAPTTKLGPHGATRLRWSMLVRTVTGIALLGAGVVSLANRTGGLANFGASASAIAVVVGGLAMFGAPALGRVLAALDDERADRILEDEMARVSAHLHDSVLQSLVLIQRSSDAREMSSLARRQERELRAWLYGDTTPGEPTTVATAVEAMTTAIEIDHRVRVETVVVGDQPLDDAGTALLAALREATINAARHADVARIDVFVDADIAELTGFVRDTGAGFDPAAVPAGHRGISDSIVGRVKRAGGVSVIESRPGAGTEVEIRIPRSRL